MCFGPTNYIGAISTNNGIRQTIDAPFTWEGNCITVNYNGSVGHAFYQQEEFYASDDVNVLYSKNFILDENLALYFCTAIFKASAKYSYTSKWTKERMEQSSIILPIRGHQLDFDFMRRYIATLKAERVATLKAYLQAAGLSDTILTEGELAALDALRQNRVNWKEIPVCGKDGAFNVSNTHSILKAQVVPDSGDIPYVGAGESNNSIQSYISISPDLIEKGNSIMIGGKTLVITYQERDYASNDSHNLALYYKDIENPSRDIQLFLVSALYKALKPKYHWGDSISNKKIYSDTFMIPINNDGAIDYYLINNLISAQIKLCIKEVLSAKELEISTTEYVIEGNEDYCKESFYPSIAAEPFEIYKWPDISSERKNRTDTILLGCWRDKKHLEWILANNLYNIRMDNRKGSAKDKPECFGRASSLYLYDAKHPEKVSVYKIVDHQEMFGNELKQMGYPRKSPGKSYMMFKIDKSGIGYSTPNVRVADIIANLPNHVNGAPVFIEPNDKQLSK